jgi:hypothetical protein
MNDVAGAERRRFPRFPFHSRAIARLGSGGEYECLLIDISYNGALFEGAGLGQLAPGDECLLTVPGNGGRRPGLELRGRVAYAARGTIGMQFHPLKWQELGGLMQIIELNLGTPEMLSRKLGRLLAEGGHCAP